MDKKIKVLTISDHPGIPSGVGTQTKYVIQALLKTGRYSVTSLGGAIKHPNYEPQRMEGYDPEDWKVYPVDGYGDAMTVRALISSEKPDILWFMTDPRFYRWLWAMEDEIRPMIPMVYYHVWDNGPAPKFNSNYYRSNDVIASISKVTHDIVDEVAPEVKNVYIPHAVDEEHFNTDTNTEEVKNLRKNLLKISGNGSEDKFLVFWNNRNARRKMPGSLLRWFKDFLDETGANATLIMHTDLKDVHGQPLDHLADSFGFTPDQIVFSTKKMPAKDMANVYKAVDCTINISDAEGFGLSTLESLACGTPIIVNMTGGLQEQVTDGVNWFGIGIEPSSKAVVGSQEVPYIYEDRVSREDVIGALTKMYNMSKEDREVMGAAGANHVAINYNFEDFEERWVALMDNIYDENGSHETRKNYKRWECIEL
jgi:glycosyltransferase involved in cell wall biosynthesis